jgi:hypothetical protein
VKLKPIPKELQGDNPLARLLDFFKQLGWSGEEYVDGTKVRLTREDYVKITEKELELAKNLDERIQIAMMWMNQGPSGSGQHPGKVELHEGWLQAEKEVLIPTWIRIGRKNHWISRACDPPFDKDSFYECKTLDELAEKLAKGNWCLGQAFYYKNLCFINQVNGGDEWLTIRDDLPFESISCGYIIKTRGKEHFFALVEDMLKATREQLKNLEYGSDENERTA